jgi:hypothetical protein
VRKILATVIGYWLSGLLLAAGAETFQLTDGTALTGDVAKYDDSGVLVRTAEDIYTNVIWTRFSQNALRQLAQQPKIRSYAQPFIIIPPSDQALKKQIKIQEVLRLQVPPKVPLLAALFSSSVGLVVMFLIYGANLYAAMEIAICRSRPIGVVMGVAAVLPFLGPIIFLTLAVPGRPVEESAAEAEPETPAVPGVAPTPTLVQPPGGIHIADASWRKTTSTEKLPSPQIFQRGKFVFNRRFFETKFAGFFTIVRAEADKDMVLLLKTPRGQFEVQRITRIAANDIHFEVMQGAARQEVMVPFGIIQEVQLKHKST